MSTRLKKMRKIMQFFFFFFLQTRASRSFWEKIPTQAFSMEGRCPGAGQVMGITMVLGNDWQFPL